MSSAAASRLGVPSATTFRTTPSPAVTAKAGAPPSVVFWALVLLLFTDYLGLAADIPLLRLLRVPTLVAFGAFAVALAHQGWQRARSRQATLLLTLFLLSATSILYAVVRSYVPAQLRGQVDYLVLFVVATSALHSRKRVTTFAWCVSAVIVILVVRNVEILTSGVRAGTFRAGTFMGDGNDFAWGLITLLPFPMFLLVGKHGMVHRVVGLVGMVTGLLGIVGTQSRGATLAIASAIAIYWLMFSRRRLVGMLVVAALAVGVVTMAPASYLQRLTNTDVESDTSAQGRLRAWRAAVSMAIDYPLGVGAGSFNSAYGRFYMPLSDGSYGAQRWISAHSIYFKVLGEAGLPGLVLLLGIIATNFRENARSYRAASAHPDLVEIEERWPATLNFGLAGYAIAGMFLGGIAYPHLYLVSALAVSARNMTSARIAPATRRDPKTAPRPAQALAIARPQLRPYAQR